jgi:hypothetical protein
MSREKKKPIRPGYTVEGDAYVAGGRPTQEHTLTADGGSERKSAAPASRVSWLKAPPLR